MTPYLAQRIQENRCAVILQLEAKSDPFTSKVMDLFDGEVLPGESPVHISQVIDELPPIFKARREGKS